MEDRNKALKNEFDLLMEELNSKRKERDGEAFYTAINEYYYGDPEQAAHDSPTKRLIQQKNTTFDHKKTMKGSIDKADYSLTYSTGNKKSYVIEPHGGQLNYNLAEKNPLKFYDQVFNQDITKHRVGKDKEMQKKLDEEHKAMEQEAGSPLKRKKTKVPVTITSKVTKRPHLKIMEKLKSKIAEKLRDQIG